MGHKLRAIIFSDGACSGNPGPGGWGAILSLPNGTVRELGGREAATTNNRMELSAILQALLALEECVDTDGIEVDVYSDSSYALRGLGGWMFGWAKRGWKTAEGNPIANSDIWRELFSVLKGKKWTLNWHYVRGHTGVPGNERCDEIATAMTRGDNENLYVGPMKSYPVDLLQVPEDTTLPPLKSSSASAAKKATYLSYVNGKLHRDPDWKSCEARVKGVRGAKFKKVHSEAEELDVLATWGVS